MKAEKTIWLCTINLSFQKVDDLRKLRCTIALCRHQLLSKLQRRLSLWSADKNKKRKFICHQLYNAEVPFTYRMMQNTVPAHFQKIYGIFFGINEHRFIAVEGYFLRTFINLPYTRI